MRESQRLSIASKAAKVGEIGIALGGIAQSVLYLRNAYGVHDLASNLLVLPHVDGFMQNIIAGGIVAVTSTLLAYGLEKGSKVLFKRGQLAQEKELREARKNLNTTLNAYDYSNPAEQERMLEEVRSPKGEITASGVAVGRARAAAEISELIHNGDRGAGKRDLDALESAAQEIPGIAALIGMLGRDDPATPKVN